MQREVSRRCGPRRRTGSAAARAAFVAAACCALAFGAGPAAADDASTRYFAELRRLGLYRIAEAACLDRLREPRLDDAMRTGIVLELSRAFAEHARHVSGDEAADLWHRARAVLDDEIARFPENPRRLLVEVETGFLLAARGDALRWQAELAPWDEEATRNALGTLAEADARLGDLGRALDERLREAIVPAPGVVTPAQWRTLRTDVQFRGALVLVERARLLPRDAPDRAAALQEAERRLDGLVGRGTPDFDLEVRLRGAECRRLQGRFPEAAALLEALSREQPTEDIEDRIVLERAAALLDQHRPDAAVREVRNHRAKRPQLPGPLRFVEVQGLLDAWNAARTAGRTDLAEPLEAALRKAVDEARREADPYWSRRCADALREALETRRLGPDLVRLLRQAETLYARGRTDEAVARYRAAFALAEKTGPRDVAFDTGFTLASVELTADRLEEAGRDFLALAENHPAGTRAPEAHLLAAYCAGRLYDRDRTRERRTTYTDLLVAQRTRYPQHSSAAEATWMLAALEERRLQFTRALELYLAVPEDHARRPESESGAVRCYAAILARLRELGRDRTEWEQAAADHVAAFVAEYPASPALLDRRQADVALRYARLLLEVARPDYVVADTWLLRVEKDSRARLAALPSETPPAEKQAWRELDRTAVRLRIVALAGRGDTLGARRLVDVLAETGSAEVLQVLDGLAQMTDGVPEATRRGLADLQLHAAEELDRRRATLSEADRRLVDRLLAEACLATNQPARAQKLYEGLLAGTPRDAALRRIVADLQERCGSPECLRSARENWRRLEQAETEGTPAWCEARLHVAETTLRLGETTEARKLATVTRLLHPGLGTPALKERYGKLDERIRQATGP